MVNSKDLFSNFFLSMSSNTYPRTTYFYLLLDLEDIESKQMER